jgi:dTDP-4-dehydrorhamnose 3,5-epimerase-like enzyme
MSEPGYERIALPEVANARGRLMFAEEARHIPFPVRRLFAIYGVVPGMTRGGHAHREQQQFLIMLSGACNVVIDDGRARVSELMDGPTQGLHIPAGLWIELEDFTAGAIAVVLASDLYDEADYVRNYDEFKRRKAIA